jgi:hypothetical protein
MRLDPSGTALPWMNQCADTETIARGRGNEAAKLPHAAV